MNNTALLTLIVEQYTSLTYKMKFRGELYVLCDWPRDDVFGLETCAKITWRVLRWWENLADGILNKIGISNPNSSNQKIQFRHQYQQSLLCFFQLLLIISPLCMFSEPKGKYILYSSHSHLLIKFCLLISTQSKLQLNLYTETLLN